MIFPYSLEEDIFFNDELQEKSKRLVFVDTNVILQSILSGFSTPRVEPSEKTRSLGPVPLAVEVESEEGALIGLSGLSFIVTKNEAGETSFSNQDERGALHLVVTAHPETGKLSLRARLGYAGIDAAQALNGARFLQALSGGGEFRLVGTIYGTDTQLTALRGRVEAGLCDGPNPHLFKLLERLTEIQNKTGTRFTIPEGAISEEDLKNIRVVTRVLETGRVMYSINSWETTSTLVQAQGLLETFEGNEPKPIVLDYSEEQSITILGVNVPLGRVLVGVKLAYMRPEDVAALRSDLRTATPGSKILTRVSPFEDCQVEAIYPRWLPIEEAAAVFRMPIFQSEGSDQFLGTLLLASREGQAILIPRFAELLAAVRKSVTSNETASANPIVTSTAEELVKALDTFLKGLPKIARFVLAAMLYKHDVLSSGKASRLAGIDRATFLMDLHKVGVPAIDLDEGQLEDQVRYVNSR